MNSANAQRQRLTVAIIVRDDAQRLGDTLASVESIVDEIIVADTGSRDNSREVAQQYGAQVVDFDWCDDFSAARNFAQSHASGEWILWLDAGEKLQDSDAAELRKAIDDGLDHTKAYMLIVKPPAASGTIAAEQVARVRLTPRRDGIRFYGRVRESLLESLQAHDIELDGLPWRIMRSARDHDPEVMRRRAERNQRLAQREIAEAGQSPTLINCLAESAQVLGECEQAIELYRQCLDAHQADSSERLEAYYGLLTCLNGSEDARTRQLALCVEALEQFPLDAQLLCAMGGYLQGAGRIDLAIRAYETAFEFGRVNPLTWHLDEITQIAAVCLSNAHQSQDANDKALGVLQSAIERNDECPRLRRALLDLHVKHGRVDVALQQIKYLALEADQITMMETAIRGAACAARRDWESAQSQLQEAYDAGCRDAVCLRYLTIVHANQQNVDAALQVINEWCTAQPHDAEPAQLAQVISSALPPKENGGSSNSQRSAPNRVDGPQRTDAPSTSTRSRFAHL